jgi:hypothetical protein
MSIKYSKCPLNILKFSNPRPPKFTQIGIFGSKINHLATLLPGYPSPLCCPDCERKIFFCIQASFADYWMKVTTAEDKSWWQGRLQRKLPRSKQDKDLNEKGVCRLITDNLIQSRLMKDGLTRKGSFRGSSMFRQSMQICAIAKRRPFFILRLRPVHKTYVRFFFVSSECQRLSPNGQSCACARLKNKISAIN